MKFEENPESFKKKLKIGSIILVCIFIFIVIINVLGNKKTDKENISKTELTINELYDNVSFYNDSTFMVKEKDNTKLIDKNLKLIENIKVKSENVFCLYDDYYLVKVNDNYILKRKGSIIEKDIQFINPELSKTDLYQDSDSFYVSYIYLYNVISGKNTLKLNDYVSAGSLLYNASNGEIIDTEVVSVEVVNKNYLYIKTINKEYLYDTKNNKKILEDYKFNFTKNKGNEFIIIEKNNKYGIATYDGKVILYPDYDDISIMSNNKNVIAVKKGEYYGLINKSADIILPFIYDTIRVYNDIYFAFKNNDVIIYDKNNKVLSENTYKIKDINTLIINEYDDFYTLEVVMDKSLEKKLIITKEGQINLVDDIIKIKYSDIFTGKEKFIVDIDNSFYLSFNSSEKIGLSEKIIDKIENAVMIDNNKVYIDFPLKNLNKSRYIYFKYNTGNLINYNTQEKIEKNFYVFKSNNLIFSKEDNITNIYNEKFDLLKVEENLNIEYLYNDYYLYKTESSSKLMEIKY
ncbi:MAG: hypothetical protein RR478_01880 [Bacilli bacterium]